MTKINLQVRRQFYVVGLAEVAIIPPRSVASPHSAYVSRCEAARECHRMTIGPVPYLFDVT